MDAPHPTAGWEKVGDRFYRKTQLYTAVFDRDLDLDNYIVAGAPYGGAVGKVTSHYIESLQVISIRYLAYGMSRVILHLEWMLDAPSLPGSETRVWY